MYPIKVEINENKLNDSATISRVDALVVLGLAELESSLKA